MGLWVANHDGTEVVRPHRKSKVTVKQGKNSVFWCVFVDKGKVPRVLQGSYITRGAAQKAVDIYIKSVGVPHAT